MKCIRNICLYLKKYISDKQFERIFYKDIDDFKSILEENIYWKILFSNFNKKEDIISMNTCECCGLEIDRDYNASINILRKGLEILKEEKVS